MESHKTSEKHPQEVTFPAYGGGGDLVRARRGRRAFRFLVATCVFLAFSLYMSENYLRYDLAESQYRMALTLHDDSARAILRNVHRRGSEGSQPLKPKYVEALAAIEETGFILKRYEEAHTLNPTSSFLIINYGCRLFLREQYKEARERFREASLQPPKNALPRYLEAAAIAAGLPPEEGLEEAIALVARTNLTEDAVIFSPPLWHLSLPRSGEWYYSLRRQLADRACAPLYEFKDIVLARARKDLAAGSVEHWDDWLANMQTLGERVLRASGGAGNSEGVFALRVQLDMIEMREQVRARSGMETSQEFVLRKQALRHTLNLLEVNERQRPVLIATEKAIRQRPLWLSLYALMGLGAVLGLSIVARWLFDSRGRSRLVVHPKPVLAALLAGLIVLWVLYVFFSARPVVERAEVFLLDLGTMGFVAVLLCLMLLGLYPVWTLPRVRQAVPAGIEDPLVFRAARRARRAAAITHARRYFGLLFGGFLCVLSLWTVCFRLMNGVYPNQTELLVRGFEWLEQEPIERLLRTGANRETAAIIAPQAERSP